MKTEVILYKQEIVNNPKFTLDANYGWSYTGNNGVDWEKLPGKIRKISGTGRVLYQNDSLQPKAKYKVRFVISGMTSGTVNFRNSVGGASIVLANADALYDTVFVADGTDIVFDVSSTFDGAISNASITEYPVAYSLDLADESGVPMTFAIDDFLKLGKRNTNYTKTTVFKGTANNNTAFNKIYNVNSESLFDPSKPSRIAVITEGLTTFTGIMYLDQVVKTIRDGIENISYEATMYGELTNIIDKFGDKTLKDLDFSRWDHPLTVNNILFSSNAPTAGGGISADSMYVYDNSISSYLQTNTDDYSKAGTSLSSATVNGFLRVRIGFATAHLFEVGDCLHIVSDNSLLSGTHTILSIPNNTSIVLTMAYANLTSTTFSGTINCTRRQWGALGYYYPLQDNGVYRKQLVNGDRAPGSLINGRMYSIVTLNGDDFSNLCRDPHDGITFIAPAVGVTFYCSDGGTLDQDVSANSWSNGSLLYRYEFPSGGGQLTTKRLDINNWHPNDLVPHIYLREAWNKMFSLIDYYYDCPLFDSNLFRRLIMPMDQKFSVEDYLGGPPATDAQMVYMNQWLPSIKLKDFLAAICNMFNLVFIESREQTNILTFVSRNDFFNGNVVDLEVDAGQPIQIKLANSLISSSYQLKYKDSADYYNTQYNKQFGNITNSNGVINHADRKYGDYYVQTNNKIAKKYETVEPIFEATVLAGNVPGAYDNFNAGSGNDKVIAATFKAEENGTNIQRHVAPRVLVAGIRGSDYNWSMTYIVGGVADERTVIQNSNGGIMYPYAGHIENIFDPAPNYDINFDTLLGQYFPITYNIPAWSQGALYGRCYQRYLADILNKNARMLKGVVRFRVPMIANLDFRNTYRFNNYYLKLSKITDWDATGDGNCVAEFLLKNV